MNGCPNSRLCKIFGCDGTCGALFIEGVSTEGAALDRTAAPPAVSEVRGRRRGDAAEVRGRCTPNQPGVLRGVLTWLSTLVGSSRVGRGASRVQE